MESSAIRYNKLYYPGSFKDIKPLPAAKSVIYVDFAPDLPSFYKDEEFIKEHGHSFYAKNSVGIEGAKEMIEDMIERTKKTYKISEEPVVDWSKTTNEKEKPIAEVLFTWDEMPGLTKKGDLTNLTYFFQTNFNVASNQLKEILEDTDIIWISRVGLHDKSFEVIDLSRNPLLVKNSFIRTYDLVTMRDKSPKNQFLDSNRIELNSMKLTREVPKILKRLRLKSLCPIPEVLHAFSYEDWKIWRKNYDVLDIYACRNVCVKDLTGVWYCPGYNHIFFSKCYNFARHFRKKHPKYTTSIVLCSFLVPLLIQKMRFM